MANRYIKKRQFNITTVKDIQIKTTVLNYLITAGMVSIKGQKISSTSKDVEKLHTVDGNVKWYGGSLKKLKTELPYDLTIPLLGKHPKEMKLGSKGDTRTPIFIAASVTVAKIGK